MARTVFRKTIFTIKKISSEMEFELRAAWYDIMDDVCFSNAFILLLYFFNTMEFPHLCGKIEKKRGKNIEKMFSIYDFAQIRSKWEIDVIFLCCCTYIYT